MSACGVYTTLCHLYSLPMNMFSARWSFNQEPNKRERDVNVSFQRISFQTPPQGSRPKEACQFSVRFVDDCQIHPRSASNGSKQTGLEPDTKKYKDLYTVRILSDWFWCSSHPALPLALAR
jgi:hypothetical protein